MNDKLFDSHLYAKRLVAAGVPEKAADVHVEMMAELMIQVAAGMASVEKQNGKIDRLDAKIDRLDLKIDRVEAQLKEKMAELKAELIRWVVGVSMLQTALVTGLVLKLVP